MGKPALGKGMKDLLPKNAAPPEGMVGTDSDRAAKELETNIERYMAQGFDIEPLRHLVASDKDRILSGIESFRDNVRKLTSAQTIIRSLEGYGFTTEIESILLDIKNTQKADEVLRRVNRLKERTPYEPASDKRSKDTPRTRVLKELKMASENFIKPSEATSEPDLNFQTTDVDSLMDDLADLGTAFNSETAPEDEFTKMLMDWEKEGIFIDRIREILSDGNRDPQTELKRFEEEIVRMRALKARLDAIDPTGIEESIQMVRIKLPYTYMATDVEHDIAELEALRKPSEPAAPSKEERPSKGPVEPEPSAPEPEPTPEPPSSPPEERAVPEPVKEERPAPTKVEAPRAAVARLHPDLSIEQLLEKAKGAYGDGNLDEALALFEEALQVDPENSKSRFMIRRIGQKK
jgi:tetratricopeptide (TPR) repeat protein